MAVALLFAAFVVVTTGVLAQLGSPFVRRDDWPFLLPRHAAGAVDPVDKVRQEGRWLSYCWWWLVGQHGTPVTAVVVLFVTYAVFVVGLWRLFAIAGVLPGALLGAALLVSPVWVRLIYWPGTLSPAFIVAAVGVWVLPWAAGRRGGLVSWLVVVTVLAVLTYPPVGGVLVIAAAVHLRGRPWREVLLMSGTFVAAFAVGVFLSFLLNWMAFGHFGVAIAGWRDPHALRSPHDLLVNGHHYAGQVVRLVATLRWSVVIGAVAALVSLADRLVRPLFLRVAAVVAVVAGLECAQTLATGLRTDVRGSLWAWLAVVAPAGLLLLGSPWSRRVGLACLAALTLLGAQAWHSNLATHQDTKRSYDAIIRSAVQMSGGRQVVLYQSPAERRTTRGRITQGTLRMMFYDQTGIVMRWCRPTECAALAVLASAGPVHDLGTVTGVVVPAPPATL